MKKKRKKKKRLICMLTFCSSTRPVTDHAEFAAEGAETNKLPPEAG